MPNNLFSNKLEEEAFLWLEAARKFFEINKDKKSYEDDINEYLEKCDEILKENNARCNFIAEILARKDISSNNNSVYNGNNRLSEIDSLTKEFIEFLKIMPLDVKEDLEFYSKVIDNRLQMIAETSLEQQTILEYYPNIDNLDYNEKFEVLAPLFDSIETIRMEQEGPTVLNVINDNAIEQVEPILTTVDSSFANIVDMPKIKQSIDPQIQKGDLVSKSASNRDEVIGLKTRPINQVINDEPKVMEKETKKEPNEFFNITDEIIAGIQSEKVKPSENTVVTHTNMELSDLEDENLEDKKESAEEETLVLKETPEQLLDTLRLKKDIELFEPPKQLLDTLGPEKDIPRIINEEKVVFNIPKGFSLTDIALAICSDINGWIDIYESNKEALNNIVKEKNNGNFNDFENDRNLFAGINIDIPTIFKKEEPEGHLKLAA